MSDSRSAAPPAASLWQHPDFMKLWVGQTISGFGSRFTELALPLLAITLLQATPVELGLLTGIAGLPWLFLTPLLGVWIDRVQRRPLLIMTDLGRGMVLLLVPLAAWRGFLRIELLYAIAFVQSLLTVGFETAYQAYLPSLLDRSQLVDGNSKLTISSSAADVAGPSLAGLLIHLLSAPLALGLDGLSFLISALSLHLIRAPEPKPQSVGQQHFWAALREGVHAIAQQPILRALTSTNTTFMFFFGIVQAVLLLVFTQLLQLSAPMIGLIFGIGGAGGLLGASLAQRISRRYGLGRTVLGASLARAAGLALLPVAFWLPPASVAWAVAALYTLHQGGWSIWAITQGSLRQSLVPAHLQGRVTASFLVVVRSAMPLGALVGGLLGQATGLIPAFVVGSIGMLVASIWLLSVRIWKLQTTPGRDE